MPSRNLVCTRQHPTTCEPAAALHAFHAEGMWGGCRRVLLLIATPEREIFPPFAAEKSHPCCWPKYE